MLVVFPPIFVADTKIIHSYNFVAPLMTKSKLFTCSVPTCIDLTNSPNLRVRSCRLIILFSSWKIFLSSSSKFLHFLSSRILLRNSWRFLLVLLVLVFSLLSLDNNILNFSFSLILSFPLANDRWICFTWYIFDTRNNEHRSKNNTDDTGMRAVIVPSKLLVLLITKSEKSFYIRYFTSPLYFSKFHNINSLHNIDQS